MENNDETLSYLKQIRDINKKRLFWTRITVILVAVLIIMIGILLPVIYETLNSANGTITQANEAIVQAQSIMVETSKKINNVDFSKLNKAIGDLSNAVTALRNLLGLK